MVAPPGAFLGPSQIAFTQDHPGAARAAMGLEPLPVPTALSSLCELRGASGISVELGTGS